VSERLATIRRLVASGDVELAVHGFDQMRDRLIDVEQAIDGVAEAEVVEDCLDDGTGRDRLLLLQVADTKPLHVVWEMPADIGQPATLIAAHHPDPSRWSADFRRRR